MINGYNKWLIWVVAVLTNAITCGLPFAFGASFLVMMDTFQTDRASATTVQALLLGVALGFGIVSGMLISKLGLPVVILKASVLIPLGLFASFFTSNIRILYFNLGILTASGISMMYIGTIVLTERLFTGRQQIMCLTLHLTFSGMAPIIYPYLIIYLLEQYGLYGTFLVFSGLTCNSFVLSALCWTNKDHLLEQDRENMQGKDNVRDILINVKKLMTKSYICLLIAFAISVSPLNVYLGIILDIDAWKKIGDLKALTLILFHTFNIVSRLIFGLLKQKKGINIYIYPVFSTLCGCAGQLVVYFSTKRVVYLIGTSLCGIAYGGIIVSSVSAVMKIVQSKQVPVGTGLQATLSGALTLGIGPVFGNIRDTSGSYGNVILIAMSGQAVAAAFYILASLSRRYEKNTMVQSEVITVSINNV